MKRESAGFTLVELLAVTILLSILAVYAGGYLNTTIKTQKKIEERVQLQQEGMSILSRLQDDITQIIFIESNQKLTFLKGDETTLEFTALSHDPPNPDDRECEEAEVSYFLEADKDSTDGKTQVLMRKEVPYLTGEQEKDDAYKAIPIGHQIGTLEFSYSDDGTKFMNVWDTSSADHPNKLPKLIKIKLTIKKDEEHEEYSEALIGLPMTDDLNIQNPAAAGTPGSPGAPGTPKAPTSPKKPAAGGTGVIP